MLSKPPVSVSDGLIADDLEKLVETQLQTRRLETARIISRYFVRVFGAMAILLVGVWSLARTYPQLLIYALLMLLMALSAGVYSIRQRRNRTTIGLSFAVGLLLLLNFLSPLLIPSLLLVSGITYVISILLVMTLLGDRGSRGLVGVFALAYLADVIGVGILGWAPFPALERSSEVWVTGVFSVVGILSVILVIRMIVVGQQQQFRRAQRLNFELEQQNQTLNDAQAALKQERNLLRLLIDTIPANVYIKDIQSRFVEANVETAHQMGAKTPNDLIGKTDFDFFSPEFARKYFADEQALIEGGLPLRNVEEANYDQRTQRESRFLTTKVPIVDHQGAVTGLVGVGLDITDQTHAREQIAQERDLLRTLIDHLPDYIFVKDANGRFVNSNAAHNRIAHVKDADELYGKSAIEVFPQELAAQFTADDQRVLHTGEAMLNVERMSIDAEGRERTVLTTKVPLRDAFGTVTGLVGISRDITEHKQAEQQALYLHDERQRVQGLHQFIGDATHDLMTPIAIINTSTDLARRAPNQERLFVHLDKIERMSEALQDRLQDMLTMAQLGIMTAGDLEVRAVDLVQLLSNLIETFRPRAEAKAQQLSGEVGPQVGILQADGLYLDMALAKIVDNAIQYADNGGTIQISIARHESQVAIAIRDTGIGIADADLEHIFDSFYRAKRHRPLAAGAGLGLSIAQRIINLHHGRIEVNSVIGSGSTFTLLLPGE